MAEKKKYFWLKLKKDFFKRHDIRVIEGMDNGKDYVLFYLKLLVESIDHDGSLRFNDMIPYDDKMLSSVTNTNVDIVRSAIQIFKALGLIEILDDKTIYMKQIESFIGSETNWAKQKRLQRTEKADIVHQLSTSSPPQVHQEYRDKSIEYRDKSIEYRDKSIENRDKSIEIDKEKEIRDIVEYLNQEADTNYRPTSVKTRTLIKARMKEGFTVDNFHTVIQKKTAEWIGTEQEKYLRPETLFGTKFESYLNQKNGKPKSTFEILQAEYEKEVNNEQNRNHQITGSY